MYMVITHNLNAYYLRVFIFDVAMLHSSLAKNKRPSHLNILVA